MGEPVTSDVGRGAPVVLKKSFQNDSQLPVTDQGAGQLEQAEVDVAAVLVAVRSRLKPCS